jgi:sterol desaturase/sphingolipid hydroxylase (fatty acid hydroxylase superfamily)
MDDTEKTLASLFTHTRYVAAATALALLWTMETVAPMFVGRSRRASHNAANLALAGINAGVALVFAGAMLFATETARAHHFGLLALVDPPGWLRWVLAILVFDCWQYWWHRLNHRVPLFWRFHAVHHADAELDASSGVRFHTGEIVLSFGARLVVLPLLGLNLLELLAYETLALPVILFHHSNLRLSRRADRALRWLIVTPWMHVVHHSRWQPETDSNYASFLSVWDRLFGSFRLRDKPHEIALGLDEWQEKEWRSLPGMLIAPFRKKPPRAPAAGVPQPGGK